MKVLGVEEFTDSHKIWRMLCAEFLGTFFLVMVGCGSVVYANSEVLVVQVALAFGFIIAAMVQSLGHISGCHINPAVTMSFFIIGKCAMLKTICYIVIQCAGATAGFYILLLMTPESVRVPNLGNTALAPNLTKMQGVGLETFVTFVFIFVIHSVCDERRSDTKIMAPLTIGITATVCHFFAIKYTGSSINPARSFGPTVVHGIWADHWVYWVGPIFGGCLAAIIYKLFFQVRKGEEEANSYDFS